MYNVSCEEVTEGTPLLSKGRYFVNITSTTQIKVLKTINHSTTCEGCMSPKAKIAPVLREKTVARNQTFNKLTCRSQILAYLTSNLIQRLVFWWRRGPGKRPSSATVCWAHFEGWSHTNTPSTQTILSNQLRFSPILLYICRCKLCTIRPHVLYFFYKAARWVLWGYLLCFVQHSWNKFKIQEIVFAS